MSTDALLREIVRDAAVGVGVEDMPEGLGAIHRPGRGAAILSRGNHGKTSLRRKRRTEDPMREFDRLPADLRAWLAAAVLPRGPRSVRRAFDRALAEKGDRSHALSHLNTLQGRLVARDVAAVWGRSIPRRRPRVTRQAQKPGPASRNVHCQNRSVDPRR